MKNCKKIKNIRKNQKVRLCTRELIKRKVKWNENRKHSIQSYRTLSLSCYVIILCKNNNNT